MLAFLAYPLAAPLSFLTIPVVEASTIVSVTNCYQLQQIGSADTYYVQVEIENDIDCSATSISDTLDENYNADLYNEGQGFIPISGQRMVLNGNGHQISNLTINRPNESNVGLLGSVNSTLVVNLNLVNVNITGRSSTAALIGETGQSQIKGVTVTGTIASPASASHVGGVIGSMGYFTQMSLVSFTGTISSESANGVGGLVGTMSNNTSITNSFADVEITSTSTRVGGLVGAMNNESSIISNSYAVGSINGNAEVGGLVGRIQDSYWNDSFTIENSFAAVQVSNTGNYTGGFVGRIGYYGTDVTTTKNYFDTTTAGTTTAIGSNGEEEDVTGIDTSGEDSAYFYSLSNEPMSLWNTETIWVATEGYPMLMSFGDYSPTLPATPQNFSATVNGNMVILSWDEVTEGGNYGLSTENELHRLEYKTAGSSWDSEDTDTIDIYNGSEYGGITFNPETPEIAIRDLALSQQYDFRVRVNGKYGITSEWAVIDATTDTPTTIEINNCEELQSIGVDPDYTLIDNYILGNDIDCSESEEWDYDEENDSYGGFRPIGYTDGSAVPFYGNFDGQGYTISGLTINRDSAYDMALISVVSQYSTIENVNMTDVNIKGYEYAGALVGENNGVISNVSVTGNVYGEYEVGGVVGYSYLGSINNVVADVNIVGSDYVGILAGAVEDTQVQDVNVEGTIEVLSGETAYHFGGLVGTTNDSTYRYVNADVQMYLSLFNTEAYDIGGLIGHVNEDVSIWDSSSTGSINIYVNEQTSSREIFNVGGLVGALCTDDPTCEIRRSDSSVDISIEEMAGEPEDIYINSIGGLVGRSEYFYEALIEESYSEGDITISFPTFNLESYNVGGFIGIVNDESEGAIIRNNYSVSDITINAPSSFIENVSGLLGKVSTVDDLLVKNNYSAGSINIQSDVEISDIAGFVAEDEDDYEEGSESIYENNFRSGEMTLTESATIAVGVGGFMGWNNGSESNLDNNFVYQSGSYNTCFAPINEWNGGESCSVASGVDTFKNSNNAPLSSWNFDYIWMIESGVNNGYPILRQTGEDNDNDGIYDAIENAAPNGGDGNNDGIQDSEQANVGGFVNGVSNQYTVLQLDDVCTITYAAAASEVANEIADSGYNYPVGMVNFTAECTPGFTTEVNIFEYGTSDTSMAVRKYKNGGYFQVSNAEVTSMNIGGIEGVQITYSVQDGGELDLDGEANGTIVDPVGLAQQSVNVPNTGFGGLRK